MDASSFLLGIQNHYKTNRLVRFSAWLGAAVFIVLLLIRDSGSQTGLASRTFTAQAARDLCASWKPNEEHLDKIILQTTPVPLKHRRLLHEEAILNHEFQREDGTQCSTYSNVYRIEHPAPPKLKNEQIFFSLATRADRISHAASIASSYLNGSNTNLLLTLPHDDNPSGEFLAEAYLSKLGLKSFHVFRASREVSYEEAWATSIIKMYNISLETRSQIKFFVVLDDDTLITSLINYRHMLDKYPTHERHMIGARSEDIQRFGWGLGLGPYGGASTALTHRLVSDLRDIWHSCKPYRDALQGGDRKLDACVNFLEGTPFRSGNTDHEIGLHQMDLRGFAGAYFQSGQQWLTLHHFGWIEMFPAPHTDAEELQLTKTAAHALDGENMFQNYLLRQNEVETVILTTAYSLVTYRPPLERRHLGLLERQDQAITGKGTWHDLEVGQGPYRPVREEGKDKFSSYIESIVPRYAKSMFGRQKIVGWTMRYERKTAFTGSANITEVEWLHV